MYIDLMLNLDIHHLIDLIVYVIDAATIGVIVYGFLYGVVLFVQMHWEQYRGEAHKSVDLSVIRIKLGSYLLLALELFICSDIILTVGEPSLEHLVQLAAIIVIRVMISHFLQKEMTELKEEGVAH